ncbi:biotin transporter BioY [Ruminococcus albus]|uniref:Biotin transporter n=1 Tax=Ruminococcus albus (strain ATCC 27210 / DSM 20455 / JCM 14654 / NCDO 2250 / 7) TaxID=697329 RepID=E6UIC6_RUMA7|nr:biotin transporter BioY [Ruminococcus albus]ADU22187.1 BioY protein [Ruminococcus albus 7 = DSM 20455]
MIRNKSKTQNMVITALFTALIAAGAYIRIPVSVCPFTLQFLFTTLAGLILGKNRGAAAVSLYVIIGLAGVPVFTGGGGIGYILQPTFGYLMGFIAGAYITGALSKTRKNSYIGILASCFAGLIVVYAFGMLYYYMISAFYLRSSISVGALFLYCFVLAVPGDIGLCIISAALAKRLMPIIHVKGNV